MQAVQQAYLQVTSKVAEIIHMSILTPYLTNSFFKPLHYETSFEDMAGKGMIFIYNIKQAIDPLTHYQATNFRLLQTESVYRQQFQT